MHLHRIPALARRRSPTSVRRQRAAPPSATTTSACCTCMATRSQSRTRRSRYAGSSAPRRARPCTPSLPFTPMQGASTPRSNGCGAPSAPESREWRARSHGFRPSGPAPPLQRGLAWRHKARARASACKEGCELPRSAQAERCVARFGTVDDPAGGARTRILNRFRTVNLLDVSRFSFDQPCLRGSLRRVPLTTAVSPRAPPPRPPARPPGRHATAHSRQRGPRPARRGAAGAWSQVST